MTKTEVHRRARINRAYKVSKRQLHATYMHQLDVLKELKLTKTRMSYVEAQARVGRRKIMDDYNAAHPADDIKLNNSIEVAA